MKIKVNGKQEDIAPCTILEFVRLKGLKEDAVVVEHNFEIVKQKKWHGVNLQDKDNLELLSFVGGG